MVDALRAVAHFRKLSDEVLGQLAREFAQHDLGAGETVYEVGEPADALYVVVHGTVVTFRDSSPAGTLARLRSGDLVGVADFFDSELRSEAARTTEESTLLRGARAGLLAFLEKHSPVELNLRLAAARDLTARAKVKLAVAHRRVVRHRINQEVRLAPAQVGSARVTLVDLSTLGMSLRGVPDHWQRDDIVRYRLMWNDKRHRFVGRVAWREAEQVGIELENPSPGQQAEIRETLEQMLRCAA